MARPSHPGLVPVPKMDTSSAVPPRLVAPDLEAWIAAMTRKKRKKI